MAKPTTIKDAIKRWEEKNSQNIAEATDVGFQFQFPPIDKMTSDLGQLTNCMKLSLSTNMIEKIVGLGGLKIRILSLSRNYIKTIAGLDAVAETLEELWMSNNNVEKLQGIGALKKLRVFYLGNNSVKEWGQFNKMQELPALEDLIFSGNPLVENLDEEVYKRQAATRLSTIKKLDGETILREEADDDD